MKRNMLKTLLFASLGIIMVIAFTSAKESVSPPGAPGKPLVIKMHKDNCTIKYKAPSDDGGARIIGYYVEKRDVSDGKWILLNKDDPETGLEYTANNLIEGSQIQFRVYAVNAGGRGPASLPCDLITVTEQ